MFKEELRKLQPIAYQTLENALYAGKTAHAYMFHGPAGTPKKEAAYLLAKSFLCKDDGFACETCETCMRIEHHNYADLLYIDGTKTSIKKNEIVSLQHEFNKTALESNGKKIYIIDHVENATVDALNSLLKFLEEPSGDMVAILLVEQLDLVLPTIISRCQIIPFKPLTQDSCFQIVKEQMDEINAYLLSNMIRNPKEINEVSESDEYQHAYFLFKGFIEEYIITPYRALLFLQVEGNTSKKKLDKESTKYFVSMLGIFFKDCIQSTKRINSTWYNDMINAMHQVTIDYAKMLEILLHVQDKLLRSINIPLLMDQMVYEMKEVTK